MQKTAYEMRISDWSSDVCSSDLSTAVAGFVASLPPTATAGAEAAEVKPAMPHAQHEQIAQAEPVENWTYTFLNVDEAAFIEAAEIGRAALRERVCQDV